MEYEVIKPIAEKTALRDCRPNDIVEHLGSFYFVHEISDDVVDLMELNSEEIITRDANDMGYRRRKFSVSILPLDTE